MPIYEYKCKDCRKAFSIFCKITDREETPECELCGSRSTSLLVSRFKTIRTEDQILESMADPSSLTGLDENDPRSVAKWAKKMAREMGEDMGDEIEAMAEEEISKGGEPGGPGIGGNDGPPEP